MANNLSILAENGILSNRGIPVDQACFSCTIATVFAVFRMSKRALISVSDKAGIAAFAGRLTKLGYEIISTGGTAKLLETEGIEVTEVSEITGFPECFGGRVKTIHPKIMGGILMRREDANDAKEAEENGIEPIDLVVVNLYPFEKGVGGRGLGVGIDDALIELIDIGGPTLLRSAAKNYKYVTAICDPDDYDRVLSEIEQNGDTSPQLRKELAVKVFLRTASYDAAITERLSEGKNAGVLLTNGMALRYGENPHQWGNFFEIVSGFELQFRNESSANPERMCHASPWKKLQGKEISYLNLLDADGAWTAVKEFTDPTAVFVKHANPSGIASHENIEEAFQRAYDADRLSAFGVIIALNRECSAAIAQKIIDQKMFVEVIVAPSYANAALALLTQKPNIRIIENTNMMINDCTTYRTAFGGMLMQNPDNRIIIKKDLTVVTKVKPTDAQIADLLFAWKVAKHAKSNAIVFARNCSTVGIGCGQTSRVDAVWIASKRAGERAKGAVMASDAFFPFPDSVEEAARHGISAIIQPGGSMRDDEVITKANELKIPMALTGIRAFRH